MQPKKWGRWVVLAIVLVFIFKNPTQAAGMANQAQHLVSQGADAISRFVSGLHL